MAKKKSELFSEKLSDFCKLADKASSDYDYHFKEVNRLDKLTQDYLHKLELEHLNYSERAKIATQISLCRKQRRISKDILDVLKPFIDFLDSKNGREAVNTLKKVLGNTRKVESLMETRKYNYRVYSGEDKTI